jgi:peptide/nickel transport system ATP-binding protein
VSDNLPWTHACAFTPRCPNAIDICTQVTPELEDDGLRALRCHNPMEVNR